MSNDEAIKQLQGMVVGAEWLSDSMVQALSVAIEALSADVVEVVRCKDCMWGNNRTRSGKRYCELSDMYQVDDGFCNWGEKIK